MIQMRAFIQAKKMMFAFALALLLATIVAGAVIAASPPKFPNRLPHGKNAIPVQPASHGMVLLSIIGVTTPPKFFNRLPHGKNAIAVGSSSSGPLTSGGGCYNWTYNPPPLTDRPCISENSSRQIVPDDYLTANSSSGWGGCTVEVDLYNATTGVWTFGSLQNCGTVPHGHYYGPIVSAVPNDGYYSEVAWDAIYNGHEYYNQYYDYSPEQIG